MEGYGVDLGILWSGVGIGHGTKYAAVPVFDSDKRVVAALFGPSWALPTEDVAAFADRVRAVQNKTGTDKSPAVNACYFGWLRSYATVAYVTKGMGSILSNIRNEVWGFLSSMLPESGKDPSDVHNVVMAYGSDLAHAVMTGNKTLKDASNSAVSSRRGYKITVLSCTPTALSE